MNKYIILILLNISLVYPVVSISEDGLIEQYKNYSSGVILSPTKTDIQNAIKLGQLSKEDNHVYKIYSHSEQTSILDNSDIVIEVVTPLRLISEYAREKSRDYRKIDMEYVKLLSKINAIKIRAYVKYYRGISASFLKRDVFLLKDGVRVDTLKSLKSSIGVNPFLDEQQKKTAAFKKNNYKNFKKILIPEYSDSVLKEIWKKQGYSEEAIKTMLTAYHKSKELVKQYSPQAGNEIHLSESDAIYSGGKINVKGKYIAVLRKPVTDNSLTSDDEIKVNINLKKYK